MSANRLDQAQAATTSLQRFHGRRFGRRTWSHSADPAFSNEITYSCDVITDDRAANAQRFHDPHWVGLRSLERATTTLALAKAVAMASRSVGGR